MSVCPSVTRRYFVEVAIGYHQTYFTIGLPHRSSFPYNTVSQYCDRDSLTGVSNGKGVLALLSQIGCAMLRVCQQLAPVLYVKRNLLLFVTSASDLPVLTIKFCSLLFVVVVHAGCYKQESLMHGGLCGKMHCLLSQLLIAVISIFAYSTCIRCCRPTSCR